MTAAPLLRRNVDRLPAPIYRQARVIGPRQLQIVALAAALALPGAASAAMPTRVLTAAEKDNRFDVDIGLTFDHNQKSGKITREWIQNDKEGVRRALDVKELFYAETTDRLLIDLRVGLFHDLELHIMAPIILSSGSKIGFAEGVDGTSTICCSGGPNADDPAVRSSPRYPITDVPSGAFDELEDQRNRSGFGDMVFGLGWAPFVSEKDEAFPTLTLRADITAPTGGTRDPADPAALAGGDGGGVGRGRWLFDLSIGASKRMQEGLPALDPYVLLGAEIPVATPSQAEKGYEPSPTGRFLVGAEIILFERVDSGQKYTFDLSFETKYVAPGRTYSELSDYLPSFDPTRVLGNRDAASMARPDEFVYGDFDVPGNYAAQAAGASCGKIGGVPCGELNRTEEYVELGGTAAVMLQFTEYAYLRAGVHVQHNTDHFLTNERVGKDLDPVSTADQTCDGAECVGRVNARNSSFDRSTNTCPAGQTCDERNPYYDPRYDALGRRLRIEETLDWTVFVSAAATF